MTYQRSISMLHFETLLYCRKCVSGTLAEDGKKSSVLSFLQVQTGLRVASMLSWSLLRFREGTLLFATAAVDKSLLRQEARHGTSNSCRAKGCHVVNTKIRGPVQADAHCRSWRAGGGIAKVLRLMSFWIWWIEDGRSVDGRWWFMKWWLLMMVVVVDTILTFLK